MISAPSLFELSSFAHQQLFDNSTYAWDALRNLKPYMNGLAYRDYRHNGLIQDGVPLARTVILFDDSLFEAVGAEIEIGDATKGDLKVSKDGQHLEGASIIMAGAVLMGGAISIGRGVLIESGAMIKSPTVIGAGSEVRQGAYIRGYCLTGTGCVLGHVTEIKHAIFLDHAKAGHFAYVGDSILGNRVNLGAGTKLANLRFTAGQIKVKSPQGYIDTGLRKLGAILGDDVQTGCNSVTNPGTILGKKSFVMPNTTVSSGVHGNDILVK
jgi:bifunctional N-acetylglucosamine-1-phosphate-uridyltransferase/glucosamine-1-phosphate-acetyltransferase GlmU-like protein